MRGNYHRSFKSTRRDRSKEHPLLIGRLLTDMGALLLFRFGLHPPVSPFWWSGLDLSEFKAADLLNLLAFVEHVF